MNVWKAQNEFHSICIAIWGSGFRSEEWEELFISVGLEYREDWALMYMEMFNENYREYVRVSELKTPDRIDEYVWDEGWWNND